MSNGAALADEQRRFAAAVAIAALLALTFGILLLPAMPEPVRSSASSTGLIASALLGTVGFIPRIRATSGRRQRSWVLIAAAGLTAAFGNVWSAFVGSTSFVSAHTVSDVTIATALVLSTTALLNFPTPRRRGIDKSLLALDGIVITGGVLVVASTTVYERILATDQPTSIGWTTLAIPALDLLLATVALLLFLRCSPADRRQFGLVAAGFVMYTMSDLAYAVLTVEQSFEFGSLLDLGWIAGYLLIGLAAWYPRHESAARPAGHRETSDARDVMIVYAVLLLAGVVQVALPAEHGFGKTQGALWCGLLLAVGARQVLLTADNTRLRRGLERRVREQTADLRRMARQNQVLVSSVGDGIYGVDEHGALTFLNPSGARALGYRPDDLLGRDAHQLFHAPGSDGTAYPWHGCYIAEAIRERKVAVAESDTYVRADGHTFPVEITASPLVDRDDDREGDEVVRGAVVVFRDMTQRREIDRMKNEFVSVVSHELRTPLTSIRGSLGLLAAGALGPLAPAAQSMADVALESTERLTRLINDILDLERIESENVPLDLSTHDAVDLLRASAVELAAMAQDVDVTIEVGAAAGRVVADRDRVAQALTNLIGNAVKFSEPGGRVTLCAEPAADEVTFRVVDTGRGIPQDRLEAIFERFQQVDSSDAREKGGTGLGLTISRGIIERHGGRIWAESTVGAGTTVSFTLPTPHVTRSAPQTATTISLLGGDPATVAELRAGLENCVQAAVVDGAAAGRPASLTVLLDPVDDSDPSQLTQAVGAAVSRAGGTHPGAAGLVALDDAPGAHVDRVGPLVAYRRTGTTPSVPELLGTIQALAAATRHTNGESP
ncbi:PAS domain-containing protein [Nocardioides sp. dk4132]|uniref:sensor histidine kinase n=1 Tax=unclassified Nocardioides TaxID=2615069 RepID=UPI00129600A6|nr:MULTISPECIES: ATP-binding protein [unclassified Nocardioides]MQW76239.1 PAS domain-containing protein [Nocardioides sp. dk4132]QGA07472.1 PAS domain-containing protein [Nocardioides sp. dk884]